VSVMQDGSSRACAIALVVGSLLSLVACGEQAKPANQSAGNSAQSAAAGTQAGAGGSRQLGV